jgi:hypothetical protein
VTTPTGPAEGATAADVPAPARPAQAPAPAGRTPATGGAVLGPRALNRATLARQFLLARGTGSALGMVEHLVGLQAQAPTTPYVGLWSRLSDVTTAQLTELVLDRRVVRVALMRGTIHLVSAGDCRALRPVLAPVLERQMRSQVGRALDGVDLAEVAVLAERLVTAAPRSYARLGELLAEQWPGRDPAALIHVARTRLALVGVPPRGLWGMSGQARHTTAEHWLGDPPGVLDPIGAAGAVAGAAGDGAGATVDDVVLRYLAAFGPASVRDAQTWSGLTRLREVVERLRPGLRVFRAEDGTELFDVPDGPRPDPATPAPARLVAGFDNILLSHADRSRIMSETDRFRVFTINGIIRPTVLVDGRVRGLWELRERGTHSTLTITPFGRLAPADHDALVDEATRLLTFAAGDAGPSGEADVRILAPG